MELTKEHFDQSLATSEKHIVKRIDEAQEELARIVADTFAMERLGVCYAH